MTIKHAYLVKGPDFVSGKTIRRVVLSVADVGPKLSACTTMSCSDGGITEGMTIDFDAVPRLNYWFVGNNQLVQYSGTAEPASLKLTADTPQRLAGKWDYDDSAAGETAGANSVRCSVGEGNHEVAIARERGNQFRATRPPSDAQTNLAFLRLIV